MAGNSFSDVVRNQPGGILSILLFAVIAQVLLLILSEAHTLLSIVCVIFLFLFLSICFFPIAGIYMWVVLYPIQSIYLELATGWRVHRIYCVELLALIVFPILLTRILAVRSSSLRDSQLRGAEFSWMLWLSAAFFTWSIICILLSQLPNEIVLNWWKLICNFIFVFYLITYFNKYNQFIKLISFFCAFASILSVIAIYSNHYGLDLFYRITNPGPFSLKIVANFINVSGNFDPRMVGITMSSGLSARHEFGIFVSSATTFSLILIKESKSLVVRSILALFILLYATAQLISIPKGSLLGFLACGVALVLCIRDWRRFALAGAMGIVGLWSVANHLSHYFKPESLKQFSIGAVVGNLARQSAFRPGTLANRLRLMGEAVEVFESSSGLGAGPDSLLYLKAGGVHGHNLFLSYGADYGILGIMFALGILVLLGRIAYVKILARPQTHNPVWLLRFAILACLLMAVFEYSFDCYIWYPHLWFMGALFLASLRIDEHAAGGFRNS